jgi:hypothetical protein
VSCFLHSELYQFCRASCTVSTVNIITSQGDVDDADQSEADCTRLSQIDKLPPEDLRKLRGELPLLPKVENYFAIRNIQWSMGIKKTLICIESHVFEPFCTSFTDFTVYLTGFTRKSESQCLNVAVSY